MADENVQPYAFTEEGARRIIEEILRSEGTVRNEFHRRRRHIYMGGGSGALVMFRLEEELQVGRSASARMMDECDLVTIEGAAITVMDDERKWFGRGDPAPSGDAGGDGRISGTSVSNVGWAMRVTGCEDLFYSIVSMGTWYRWIEGVLSADSWVIHLTDVDRGWDGDTGANFEYSEKFVRIDDVQASGEGGDLITLQGACIDPVTGLQFKAVFDEISRLYRVVMVCCPSE